MLTAGHPEPVLNVQHPCPGTIPPHRPELCSTFKIQHVDGKNHLAPTNLVTSPPSASTSQRHVPVLWQVGHRRVETDVLLPPLEHC